MRLPGLIAHSLWLACSAAAIVLILRALTPIKKRVVAGIKPWSCDLCMSLWSTLAVLAGATVLLRWWDLKPLFYGPCAFVGCLFLVQRLGGSSTAALPLPELPVTEADDE